MASNDENGPLRKCRRTAPRAQQARASQSSEQASSLEQWLQRAFAWGHVFFEEALHSQSCFFFQWVRRLSVTLLWTRAENSCLVWRLRIYSQAR